MEDTSYKRREEGSTGPTQGTQGTQGPTPGVYIEGGVQAVPVQQQYVCGGLPMGQAQPGMYQAPMNAPQMGYQPNLPQYANYPPQQQPYDQNLQIQKQIVGTPLLSYSLF